MAAGCPITGNGLTSICSFHRLTSLDIGRTKITASALATSDLPKELQSLGVYEIQLTDEAVKRIASLTALRMLNCNHSGLTIKQFEVLADLPKLKALEALGCPVPPDVAIAVSRRWPQGLLRLDSGVWKNGDLIRSRQLDEQSFELHAAQGYSVVRELEQLELIDRSKIEELKRNRFRRIFLSINASKKLARPIATLVICESCFLVCLTPS